jgi:phosphocarrier protein FPr
MVGIVLVSHSAKLAEAVKELADQMAKGQVAIATAGGIDDLSNPFGTDAVKVQQAIDAVYSDDGVLVLMDLGSAVLSAEMARDFLLPEQRAKVILSPAPFVEGALAASIQASVGSSLAQVAVEALTGQVPKAEQLGEVAPYPQPLSQKERGEGEGIVGRHQARLVVRNKLGLHARPAALFVQTANRFQATITVENFNRPGRPGNAKSATGIMLLTVRQNDPILVSAEGPDAADAIVALSELVETNFGEPEDDKVTRWQGDKVTDQPVTLSPRHPVTLSPLPPVLVGIPASDGIAIGPALIYRPAALAVERHTVADPAAEWARFQAAVEAARQELVALQARAEIQVGTENARIFEAHQRFLEDPAILDQVKARIGEERLNAEAAMADTAADFAEIFRATGDELLVQRATDLRDVGQRVVELLAGRPEASLARLPQPSVVVAYELTPSDTATMDKNQVLGFCTAVGGATSHTAILARALSLPAVVGLGEAVLAVTEGTTLVVDGAAGEVRLAPDAVTLAGYQARQAAAARERAAAETVTGQPAVTRDGRRVEVGANVGNVEGARQALAQGAEGVGLLRTEFLYLDRSTPPTEDEQVAAYVAIAEALQGRPVIVRSLDIGGDKPAPYLDLGQELNPFLGWRAIRYCLDRPEVIKTQLRAILRAAADHNLKLMFPMIATVEEVRRTRALLNEARLELAAAGRRHADSIETGIMVEVPSAAVIADQLAREVDFFSIGTNDLAQYTLAADRTNARVAALADPLYPAVLRLIKQVIEAAHAAGRWVGMCGEMAGQPEAIPILLGLGLDEFSMSPAAIPRAKQIIRSLTVPESRAVAAQVLNLDSARAVRDYVREVLAALSTA